MKEEFLRSLSALLGHEDIQMCSQITDIPEWDSLTVVSFSAMVLEKYDVLLSGEKILRATTVEDLFNLLCSCLENYEG